jgi:hypothetical protein
MQNTNLNTNPYYDDFDVNKNFYRVLFRPGYPVQTRELTTLQSILQNQVENFGSSIYKDGAMIIPGQIGYDLNYHSIQINPSFNGISVERYRTSLIGLTITGTTSNVSATIVDTLSAIDPINTSGNIVLYVKYTSSSTNDNSSSYFVDGENLIANSPITIGTTVIPITSAFASTISSNSTAIGSAAYINNGVYYIRGFFINVQSQTIILDPFGITPSYRIGLQVQENIVTPEEDSSLYDNSIGTSNYTAPGAHRLQIKTILTKKPIDTLDTSNFIELLRLQSGYIQYFVNRTAYSELEKEIARRTYETNGDYVVEPFKVSLRESLNNGINNGVYGAGISTQDGNVPLESKLAVQVSPGTAFVRGYEIQTIGTKFIDADKPRNYTTLINQTATNTFGNYIEVALNDLVGLFDLTTNVTEIKFYDQYTTSRLSAPGPTIGSGRLVNIEKSLSNLPENGIVYKLYLIDIQLNTGKLISDIKSLSYLTSYDDEDSYANLNILNDRIKLSGNITYPVIVSGSTGILTGVLSNFQNELRINDIIFAPSSIDGSLQKFQIQNINNNNSVLVKNISATDSIAGSYVTEVARLRIEESVNNKLITVLSKSYAKSLTVNTLPVRSQQKNLPIVSYGSGSSVTISAPSGFTFTNINDIIGFDSNHTPIAILGSSLYNNNTTLTLNLSNNNSGTADVAYNLYKTSPVRKEKTPNIMKILMVDKTIGTGNTTNGLTQSTSFIGTRVEDSIISLGIPDVYKIHCVLESNNGNAPIIPNFIYTVGAGVTNNYIIGETITGTSSNAVAKVVSIEKQNNTSILYFVYVSTSTFTNNETIIGYTSNISSTINGLNNGSSNITSRYTLNDGQTDQLYTFSTITRDLSTPAPTHKIFVIFDYFEHGITGDFYSVNSYSGIDYKDIPSYKGMSLSNVIDYRYSVNKTVFGVGSYTIPFVNNSTQSDVLSFSARSSAGFNTFNILKSGYDCIFNIDYYLGRIDKLTLTSAGNFVLIKGDASENPQSPNNINDGMQIVDITYPPYVLNTSQIKIKTYDNKRYTMKDIASLESRLKNVEYYTQLNLLELDTSSFSVTDANGLQRFKNGFLVDNFTDFSKSDTTNIDFECAIDSVSGSLRPSHYTTNVPLSYNFNTSTNVTKSGNIITLPYTSIVSIQQPVASRVENVNPFNVVSWVGNLNLTPSSDDWVDTTRLNDAITSVEGDYANTARLMNADQNGYAPTEWGAWQTTWTGTPITTNQGQFRSTTSGLANIVDPNNRWLGPIGHVEYLYQRETTSTSSSQSRNGIRNRIVPRTDTVNLGDRTISNSFETFIRSRNISFSAKRLKPKTKFYVFFDGTNVTSYVTPKLVEIVMQSGTFQIGETVVGTTSGAHLKIVAPNDKYATNPYSPTDSILPTTYSQNSTVLNHDIDVLSSTISPNYFGSLISGETIVGQTSQAVATTSTTIKLVTDNTGILYGSLFIPNPNDKTNPRFNTGQRSFKLTTSDTNSTLQGSVDSSSETNYTASGTLQTIQGNVLSIRNSNIVTDTVNDTRTVISTQNNVRQLGWYDPLAESFLVTSSGGEFLTGVDLFFQSKDDSNIPISVQLRTMQNGYPTKEILPFSDVTVNSTDVMISEDSSVATRFNFPSPVFVKENQEYALVVLSDSNKYNIWISRMGDNDIQNGTSISNQPYTGVLFKSQNASTWTADQYEDIKFTLYRANFTSLSGNLILNNGNENNLLTLKNNPLSFTQGSSVVTVYHSNHGMHSNGIDNVSISNITSQIPSTYLTNALNSNGSISSITVVDASQFPITIGGNPISSSNPGYLKIDNEILSYTAISGNIITIQARAVSGSIQTAHSANAIVNCYSLYGIPLTVINTQNIIYNPTLDTYEIHLSVAAEATSTGGGNAGKASQNVRYDLITPQIQVITNENTKIITGLNGTSGKSIDGTETSFVIDSSSIPITLNDVNYLSAPKIIASKVNETSILNGNKSLTLSLNISTESNNLSPVIDLDRASVITTTNRIRGINSTISATSLNSLGDISKAIYITKAVTLNTNASSLKVMFSAWRPTNSIIDVYYKIIPSNNQQPLDSFGYIQFSTDISNASIPQATDAEIYKDYEFNANNLNFGSFAIKIVMRSQSQVMVPIIKDFRVMALS